MFKQSLALAFKAPSKTKVLVQATKMFSIKPKLAKFDYEDPLGFEELLTEEEKMVRDSARKYAREKLLPRVIEAYNKEKFDIKIMREMGELGFLGCTISEYDLPGVSSVAYGNLSVNV